MSAGFNLDDLFEPFGAAALKDVMSAQRLGKKVPDLAAISPAIFSAAISLKRIADALDSLGWDCTISDAIHQIEMNGRR